MNYKDCSYLIWQEHHSISVLGVLGENIKSSEPLRDGYEILTANKLMEKLGIDVMPKCATFMEHWTNKVLKAVDISPFYNTATPDIGVI